MCWGPQVKPTANQPWSSSSLTNSLRLFEATAAYNAWNYNKNFHQDCGKNSLDVIGHTHTSGLCLSPIRHSRGACGPSCGASQSVHSPPLFFTASKCAPATQIISLTKPQHSHRPVRPIYLLLRRRADTWGNQESGFSLWSYSTVQHEQLPGGAEEGKSVRMQLTPVFTSTFW